MNNRQIVLARSVWLFDLNEINPLGVALGPVHTALRERYQFLQYPSRPEDFAKTEITYQQGEFSGIGVNLFMYSDGLIADTRTSTETSDAFLNDLLTWAQDTFKFRYEQQLIKKKAYDSQVVFNSDVTILKALGRLEEFAKTLENLEPDRATSPQDVVAIAFRNEKDTARPSFTFERRDNTPFSENKYFSRAALSTKEHLHLIEEFEQLMKS